MNSSPTKAMRPLILLAMAALAVTSLCARSPSPAALLADAVDATNLVWASSGNVAWLRQTAVTHDGVDAAQSGAIVDYQESWLQTAVTGPGTLTFWWRVSSEFEYDWLRFHIDGILQEQISGEVNWQQQSYLIAAGSHTLRWRYVKDPNTAGGSDRGWVDQVSYTPGTGAPVFASQPEDKTAWEGANVILQAVALGTPPLAQQWYFNQTNVIDSATNATLVISNVLPARAGSYRLVASNALGGPVTSDAAQVTLANNGPVNRIILFVDSPVVSPFVAALAGLGMNFEQVFNEFDLNAAVSGADPATTLVIVDAPQNNYAFFTFAGFINAGGRVAMGANALTASPSLAALFNVAVDVRLEAPQRVYDWRGSPLFTGMGASVGFVEIGLVEDVQRWHALPGGHAVAGFEINATPGAGAIVIGNNGRTIANGFWSGAGSPGSDAVQLAQNEILFLTGPVSASVPVIKVQPASVTTAVGRSATMRVVAWGATPLSYQWFVNDSAVPGATAATLTVPAVQLADAGNYTVVVSNSFGSVTSSPAALTVDEFLPVPTTLLFADYRLTSPWEPALIARGYPYQLFTDEPSFNAAVSAANPDTTLVVVDGILNSYAFAALPGFISRGGRAVLQYWNVLPSSPLAAAFQISVGTELLTPAPVHDWGGSPLFLGVNGPLMFLDYFNRDGLRLQPLAGAQAVAGFVPARTANQAALVIGNSGRTIVHGMWLEVAGSFKDAVRLARNELDFLITPMTPTAPFITTQPADSLAVEGNTGLLVVNAGGSLPLTYQWRRDSIDIVGATNEQYHLAGVQLADSGAYDVVISNAHGTVTSSAVVLVVLEPSSITGAVLFHDAPLASPYADALVNLGIPFQEVASDASFNSALAAADPASTLVVVDASWDYHYLSALENFVLAGGRAVVQDWTLSQAKSSAALLQVGVGAPFFLPQPVYDWGGSTIFVGLTSPLPFTNLFNLDGRVMQPIGDAQALAGYTATLTPTQAAIVLGNLGRTIVNGFVLEEIISYPDSVRLAQNEIELLSLRPPIVVRSPISQSVVVGGSVTFSVEITGNPPPFNYEWRKTTGILFTNRFDSNERVSFFRLDNVDAGMAGSYRVVIRNAAVSSGVSPAPFTLTVLTDSDADGLPDVWEAAYPGCADPALDCDNDGLTNIEEYHAGTDPANGASVLRIDRIAAGNSTSLEFQALSNKTYTVQYTDGLGTAAWAKLADIVARHTNGPAIVTDPSGASHRYYRLVTPREP